MTRIQHGLQFGKEMDSSENTTMNIRRWLLFSGYSFLREMGYIRLKNSFQPFANIIAFHRVNNYDSDLLTTPTPVFEEMVDAIRKNYTVCSLPELIHRIKNHLSLEHKTVVITFDDGYKDNYLNAAPILHQYHIPASFFITSGYIGTEKIFPWDEQSSVSHPLMTWDEVRELAHMGFDIGGHTVNHPDLAKISLDHARDEIVGCKEQIERELHKEIHTFAFPFGERSCIRDEVIKLVREAGYDCCCSLYGGKVTSNSDLFNLHRVVTFPSTIELMMELDDFMVYVDGHMKINLLRSSV